MSKQLCIFGEVLFDIFPDGHRVLGGAPFNVAWHLHAFGQAPAFISRVGKDPEGTQVRNTMSDWGMDLSSLQTDDIHPTGAVNIQLIDGEPEYEIVENCAYDNIEPLPSEQTGCHLLYHGSLAIRTPQSEQALQSLIQNNPSLVFIDVNLRSPWWKKSSVLQMLNNADWVKLNIDELDLLFPSDKAIENRMVEIITELDLQGIVLTHGSKGAEILTADGEHVFEEPQKSLEIADTVGAGDAFSSVVLLGLNKRWSVSQIAKRAQIFASAIVQQRGATVFDPGFYNRFKKAWELD